MKFSSTHIFIETRGKGRTVSIEGKRLLSNIDRIRIEQKRVKKGYADEEIQKGRKARDKNYKNEKTVQIKINQ